MLNQDYYLQLLGIERWVRRDSPGAGSGVGADAVENAATNNASSSAMAPASAVDVLADDQRIPKASLSATAAAPIAGDWPVTGPAISPANSRSASSGRAVPVTPTVLSPATGFNGESTGTTHGAGAPASDATFRDEASVAGVNVTWDVLRQQVSQCQACELAASRTQTVFGIGNIHADWLVIGEAPGADEDRQGEPFVGRAGQLLNAMLRGIGLSREQVYIANVLKCRPPNNRDPLPAEVAHCESFLQQQVALIQPRLILVLGRIAAQNLLKTDIPISRLRGDVFTYGESGIPVVVTYHPAYLLRSPSEKRKAWEDLKLARRVSRAEPKETTG